MNGSEPKIPVFLAVGFWAASGLAVLGFTWISFKETANGLESGALSIAGATNPLVASADVLTASLAPQNAKGKGLLSKLPTFKGKLSKNPLKPLDRGLFTPSN